ncbi:MAG: UDP-galactopyranose mutase, partial [Nitrospirae bacterium]
MLEFDNKYGKLQYRSLNFEFRTFNVESYQEVAVVNYPNDYDFTRI